MAAGRAEAGCAPLIVRTSKDHRDWDGTLSQNLSFAVDVRQKEVECFEPLLEAAHDLVPFLAREYLRQQVTEPSVMMIAGRNFEGDSQFAQGRIQAFLKFPQVRRGRSFQLTNNGGIVPARLPSAGIKHFVPAFLKALSVFLCHAGLSRLTGNDPARKVGCKKFPFHFQSLNRATTEWASGIRNNKVVPR
jgi:hypothetical protein